MYGGAVFSDPSLAASAAIYDDCKYPELISGSICTCVDPSRHFRPATSDFQRNSQISFVLPQDPHLSSSEQ